MRMRAPEAWMKRRGCRDMNPAPWFSSKAQDVADARSVCSSCPVHALCLSWALEEEAELRQVSQGMFGGKTPAERRELLGLKPLGKPGRPRKALTAARALEMLEARGVTG